MTKPRIDDTYLGVIYGVRRWYVRTDGVLESLTSHLHSSTCIGDMGIWRPGEIKKARCRKKRHANPMPKSCSCGVYASLAMCGPRDLVNPYVVGQVSGIVAMWGIVVVHEFGLRAQYARVEALWDNPAKIPRTVPPDKAPRLKGVVATLETWRNVVPTYSTFSKMAAGYGIADCTQCADETHGRGPAIWRGANWDKIREERRTNGERAMASLAWGER